MRNNFKILVLNLDCAQPGAAACLNGATCNDTPNGMYCTCASSYSGSTCSIKNTSKLKK